MSTRYVWYKCTKETKLVKAPPSGQLSGNINAGNPAIPNSYDIGIVLAKDYGTYNDEGKLRYYPVDGFFVNRDYGKWSVDEYSYAFSHSYYTGTYRYFTTMFTYVDGADYWTSHVSSTTVYLGSGKGGGTLCCSVSLEDAKGSLLDTVANSSSSAYPNNGVSSDGYWYEYQGSDSIDPSSVSVSRSNRQATITVTPVSVKWGTISYTYQYQYNNGSWITIGTTTSKTNSFVIPDDASSYRARVLAKDNLGFTSSTYVYSVQNLIDPISANKLYIGISDTARKSSKVYVGVNGVARKVIRGYVGVNGVARRFL